MLTNLHAFEQSVTATEKITGESAEALFGKLGELQAEIMDGGEKANMIHNFVGKITEIETEACAGYGNQFASMLAGLPQKEAAYAVAGMKYLLYTIMRNESELFVEKVNDLYAGCKRYCRGYTVSTKRSGNE